MPRQKKTKVIVSALEHAIRKNEACIVLELKVGAEDHEPGLRHSRDLDRALQTFRIYADTENNSVFASGQLQGPYSIGDSEGLMAMIVLSRAPSIAEEMFSTRIRTGVNGISSLLKAAGYAVKVRIKPAEQLPIPETDGAPVPAETPAAPPAETPAA
jgi:hypothetical protein